jgi:hypothetical protein
VWKIDLATGKGASLDGIDFTDASYTLAQVDNRNFLLTPDDASSIGDHGLGSGRRTLEAGLHDSGQHVQPQGVYIGPIRPTQENAMRECVTPLLPLFIFAVGGCGGGNTASNVSSPGEKENTKTAVLEQGAAMLQNRPPVEALNAYLDGFHFYNGNMRGQMEAHHYCAVINEDLIQCVIYDGNVAEAKIMGVEYIVSKKLFTDLPEREKALWHSHVHEVKSGQLIAPGVPELAEHELMEKLIGTYGKTLHTWHTDLHKTLPLGAPQVMMGFTADGQADPAMVAARDKRFGISSADKKQDRADIAAPSIAPGADAWQNGKVVQLQDPTGTEHASPHGAQTDAARPTTSRPAE